MINFEAILMKNKGRKEEKQNMNVRRNNVPGGYDVQTSNSQTDKGFKRSKVTVLGRKTTKSGEKRQILRINSKSVWLIFKPLYMLIQLIMMGTVKLIRFSAPII